MGAREVHSGGRQLALGGMRDRRLLALLLLEVGHVVPLDRLVDAMWEDDPPRSAVKQVRNAASRLRSVLGAERIIGDILGYRIVAADHEADQRIFTDDVAQARRFAAEGNLEQATKALADGLALWRGPALAGAKRSRHRGSGDDLERTPGHRTGDVFRIRTGARPARHGVVRIDGTGREGPLREKPTGQLMLALHRCGRSSDALRVFTEFRARMADDTGLDPSTELCELHHKILTGNTMTAALESVMNGAAKPTMSTATRAVPIAAPRWMVHADTRIPTETGPQDVPRTP